MVARMRATSFRSACTMSQKERTIDTCSGKTGTRRGSSGGHEVRQHADPAARDRRLQLGDEARALQPRPQALRDLVEIVELRHEDEVVDVADHLVRVEILGAADRLDGGQDSRPIA